MIANRLSIPAAAPFVYLTIPPGRGPREDSLEVRGATLPAGENSVQRAVALFREVSGIGHGAVRVRLHKAIPAGAGLGGGSSDAVAALKGLRGLFGEETAGLNRE